LGRASVCDLRQSGRISFGLRKTMSKHFSIRLLAALISTAVRAQQPPVAADFRLKPWENPRPRSTVAVETAPPP